MENFSNNNIEGRKIGLVGFCFDINSSFMTGTADAPPLIRKAFFSDSSNLWSENGTDLGRPGLIFDAGDVTPIPHTNMNFLIEKSIASLLDENLYPLSLGGDHSVTYPILKAVSKKNSEITILHFDAHPDLYDEFQGNPYSHACPFARIMEENLVKRLVQVGIRTMNDHQREQARRFGVEVIEMKNWDDTRELKFDTPVYISFDIDGLDPASAPGVSHQEPGGLTTRQAVDLINRIDAPVVGADIVEFNPRMDIHNMTAMVCAKLLKEISAKILESC